MEKVYRECRPGQGADPADSPDFHGQSRTGRNVGTGSSGADDCSEATPEMDCYELESAAISRCRLPRAADSYLACMRSSRKSRSRTTNPHKTFARPALYAASSTHEYSIRIAAA